MSTRSNIGIRNADGTVTSVYCHSDGYPSHNGKLLLEHFNSEEKAREIIALGDLSFLAESLYPKEVAPSRRAKWDKDAPKELRSHSFDMPQDGVTIAYGRDRGETDIEARTSTKDDWESYFDNDYGYLWENGKWMFCHCGKNWKPLTEKDCVEKRIV